jgi:hypothetical protein
MNARVTAAPERLDTCIVQTRLDGATHFSPRNIQIRNRLTQIARAGCGLFQPFRGTGYSPCAEPARRALERVGRRRRVSWLGTYDPLHHQRDLTGENLQNLALEALIAQRHPPEVAFIEDAVRPLRAKIGRPSKLCHDILSPPTLSGFCPAWRYHSIAVPKAG